MKTKNEFQEYGPVGCQTCQTKRNKKQSRKVHYFLKSPNYITVNYTPQVFYLTILSQRFIFIQSESVSG